MATLRVGLTGGIAAGKSTVSSWLRDAGYLVVDADQIVADLYRPAGEGARLVGEMFGLSFLTTDGGVDHRRLAQRVFADQEALGRLEAAIHPLVRREFANRSRETEQVAVLEAPLLVEAGFAPDFDLLVTVESAPALRLERAVARGLSEKEAASRLAAQTDEATRVAAADVVLRNEGSLTDLRRQVDELIEEIAERLDHGG